MRRWCSGAVLMALATLVLTGPPGAAAAAAPQITWRATGGIAGLDHRLVIDAQGRAVLTHRRPDSRVFRRRLTRAAHRRVLRIVRAAHLERGRAVYASRIPIADGIDHAVTFRGRTVVVRAGSNPPATVARAFAELAKLSASMTPR